MLLFGQSAGAKNTFIVSTLPQARSLINAAVSESGGVRDIATSAVVQQVGESYARSLNCSVSDVCKMLPLMTYDRPKLTL